eukprot:1107908-Rhodomonas_salina.1
MALRKQHVDPAIAAGSLATSLLLARVARTSFLKTHTRHKASSQTCLPCSSLLGILGYAGTRLDGGIAVGNPNACININILL